MKGNNKPPRQWHREWGSRNKWRQMKVSSPLSLHKLTPSPAHGEHRLKGVFKCPSFFWNVTSAHSEKLILHHFKPSKQSYLSEELKKALFILTPEKVSMFELPFHILFHPSNGSFCHFPCIQLNVPPGMPLWRPFKSPRLRLDVENSSSNSSFLPSGAVEWQITLTSLLWLWSTLRMNSGVFKWSQFFAGYWHPSQTFNKYFATFPTVSITTSSPWSLLLEPIIFFCFYMKQHGYLSLFSSFHSWTSCWMGS